MLQIFGLGFLLNVNILLVFGTLTYGNKYGAVLENDDVKVEDFIEPSDHGHSMYKRSAGIDSDPNFQNDVCMSRHHIRIVHGRQNQKALIIDLGSTAQLPCHLCGASEQQAKMAMLWFRFESQKDGDKTLWTPREVEMDMHDEEKLNRVYSTLGHTLIIKDFQPADVGTYFCEASGPGAQSIESYTFRADHIDATSASSLSVALRKLTGEKAIDFLYHLDVALPMKATLVSREEGSNFPKPAPALENPSHNWRLVTQWGKWGECSRCGSKGEKRRTGHCMVEMVDANFLARPKFLDHVLRFFPDGAPCHSSLFFNFVDVVARRDETEVAFCEKKCEKKEGGLFNFDHLFQDDMHEQETAAEEQKIMLSVGTPLIMTCPTADNKSHIPVQWANGTEPLLSLEIANRTNNRVTIGPKNELRFVIVKKYDNNTYTCWQGEYLKARYLLELEIEVHKESTVPYLGYLGLTYVVDVVIFIIVYMYTVREKVTQVRHSGIS